MEVWVANVFGLLVLSLVSYFRSTFSLNQIIRRCYSGRLRLQRVRSASSRGLSPDALPVLFSLLDDLMVGFWSFSC